MLIRALCLNTAVAWLSWSKSEKTNRLTVFSFITPKVSPVAEHDLQVITLIKCCQDSQQQQYDPQTTSQLQTIHIYSQRDTAMGGVEKIRFVSVIVQRFTEVRYKQNKLFFFLQNVLKISFACALTWVYKVNIQQFDFRKYKNLNYLPIGKFSKSVSKIETHSLTKLHSGKQNWLFLMFAIFWWIKAVLGSFVNANVPATEAH